MGRFSAVVVHSRDFSCSGIVLDEERGIILTVGSVVSELVESSSDKDDENVIYMAKDQNREKVEPELFVEVILRKNSEGIDSSNSSSNEIITLQGTVIIVWRDQLLHEMLQKVFPNQEWKFGDQGSEDAVQTNSVYDGSSSSDSTTYSFNVSEFVLLQVKDLHEYLGYKTMRGVTGSLINGPHINIGDTVTVVGTPFGSECPSVFLNSLSKGIVSNVIGQESEMILTDARSVPGCEGCPVFTYPSPEENTNHVYGIVIAPLCWRCGESIGLTLVYSINHLLQSLKKMITTLATTSAFSSPLIQFLNPPFEESSQTERLTNQLRGSYGSKKDSVRRYSSPSVADISRQVQPSIVLIQCGNTWGSGIIVDAHKGLVVTCSHILGEGERLRARSPGDSHSIFNNLGTSNTFVTVLHTSPVPIWYNAEVIFATEAGCSLDFALLKIQKHPFLKAIKFRNPLTMAKDPKYEFRQGEEVLAIGHSIFGNHTMNYGSSVTSGVLSSAVSIKGEVVLIQSSAAVHCGGSGGALVSAKTGELLGMVTSNTKDAILSTTFPHINFSIPVNLIVKLIACAISGKKTPDVDLHHLISGGMQDIWKLNNSIRPASKL